MIYRRLLVPDPVRRRTWEAFSWVDRQFVHEYAARLSGDAVFLYLFLGPRRRCQSGTKPARGAHKKRASADAFWLRLNAMRPRSLGRRDTFRRVAPQKAGLSLALLRVRSVAAELPEHVVPVLRVNLIYQNAIVVQSCACLEQAQIGHEARYLGVNLRRCDRAGRGGLCANSGPGGGLLA